MPPPRCKSASEPLRRVTPEAVIAALPQPGDEVEGALSDTLSQPGQFTLREIDQVRAKGKSKPIRIFAQREISNDQLEHARSVLELFLEPVPGSRYGADKTAIANAMGDSGATLVMLKGHDGEFEFERVRGVRGQALGVHVAAGRARDLLTQVIGHLIDQCVGFEHTQT